MEEADPRRKFPRIFLVGIPDLKELIGAKVQWENAQRTEVLDMSYTGMAVVRPSGIEFEKGKRVQIQMLFSGLQNQNMQIELIRESEKLFGVQFCDLTKENIKIIDMFLSDKILGRNLRPVNSQFFHPNHGFDFWFHGPNNTNLYIWTKGPEIKKAVFESGGLAFLFDGQFTLQKSNNFAEGDEYVVFPLSKREESGNLGEFLSRSLKVLSQVENAPPAVWTLIDLIQERLKSTK